jgi:hypothetical protein
MTQRLKKCQNNRNILVFAQKVSPAETTGNALLPLFPVMNNFHRLHVAKEINERRLLLVVVTKTSNQNCENVPWKTF